MERLYTPWRRAFIEGPKDGGCFLCTAAHAEASDQREHLVLYRGECSFVLLNRYPYNNGHLLIAPYEHSGDLAALDPTTAAELMHVSQRTVAVLTAEYHPHGFNMGLNLGKSAGAGIPDHLHVHVVPRWDGDTNFMPIFGHAKVLPESLEQTYERLEPRFRY